MALIPSLKDIPDLEPVEGGVEYDLRIIKAIKKKFNSGRNGVQLLIDIVDEDNAQNIFHNILFGNDRSFNGDDDEASQQRWRQVKEFVRKLGLDPEQDLEAEDFTDISFVAIVEYNDGIVYDDDGKVIATYPPKNELGRITG